MDGKYAIVCSLFSVIILSMCTSPVINMPSHNDTMKVKIDAPDEVFENREFTVTLEVENAGNVTFENVLLSFFNTGSFQKLGNCSMGPFTLEPEKVQVLICSMRYAGEVSGKTSERIDASIRYVKKFSTFANFQVLSLEEYEKRRMLGTFKNLSSSFRDSNSELSLETEISENPVIKDGREKYIYFTLSNRGSSIIDSVYKSDIEIRSVPPGVVMKSACDLSNVLFQDRGVFSKISCPMSMYYAPEDYTNVFAFFDVMYSQESRASANIKLMS